LLARESEVRGRWPLNERSCAPFLDIQSLFAAFFARSSWSLAVGSAFKAALLDVCCAVW
jgi:hypothetical protein